MKYKEWLREWLCHYIRPVAKEKTCRRYAEIAEKHLIPKLGDKDLCEITVQEAQWFVTDELQHGNQKTGGGMSPSSVNLTISVIQNSMRTANTLGLVPTYELHKIKRPKVKEKKVECFTKAEQKQIEVAVLADNRPKMIGVLLCLYTGLRLGEVMALEWSDIDFQKGELSVTKACHDTTKPGGGFERITGTPKTDSSVRTLADILGHDNPMITLKRYAHSMEEHKKEMMDRVGKLL